jgi:hypothetical protein
MEESMGLENELTAIERELWRNDADLYGHHLDESALLLFPETGVITRSFALDAIRQENAEGRRWAEVMFSNVRAMQVTSDTALLIYAAEARWEHEAMPVKVLASSLYRRSGGRWRLMFHQQTVPQT